MALHADFFIFRVQMFQKQMDLLRRDNPHPSDILKEVVSAKLRKDSKSRSYFTLEFRDIGKGTYYMKLVRSRKVKVTEIDHEELVEVEHPDNPYIHVFLLADEQLLVINRDSKFANDVNFSAWKFGQLIAESSVTQNYGLSVDVSPVRDPVQIVEYIRKAWHIGKLGIVVRRENVFDASEYNRSFKQYTSEVGGQKTKTEVSGGMIKAEAAEDMVRAAASTGDDAYADVKMDKKHNYVRKVLSGTTVSFSWDEKIEVTLQKIAEEIKSIYRNVRNGDEVGDE